MQKVKYIKESYILKRNNLNVESYLFVNILMNMQKGDKDDFGSPGL